jgi:large subunit ribosomal protein L18
MTKIEYRRKREGKTNYKKRLNLLLNDKPRLIIRKTLKNIIIQIVKYEEDGDKIIVGVNSKELEKTFEWKFSRNNIPASYLTGYMLGKKAIKKDIKEAILDIGLEDSVKGSKLYSALKGVLDAGLKIPCSKDILPGDDVIKGKNIVDYAKKLSEKGDYEKIFSSYVKKGIKVEDLPKHFEEVKKKID